MVDVGDKQTTDRESIARGWVYMERETLEALRDARVEKGEVEQVARIAGIQGAKQTSELVPLCHQIPLDRVDLEFSSNFEASALEIVARAACRAKTGVEMEALTAVSTAALTVYDMCKSRDRSMVIGDIHLVEKRGGSSGTYQHPEPPGPEPVSGEGET